MMRDKKIWMRTIENQKIRMCSCQVTYCFSQDRKYDDYSNKNRQNWSCSIFKQSMSVWNRIFCLSMWLNKKNHSACDNILFSFHWNKTSNNRFIHRLSEYQKSHQQLRKDMQINQIIHSVANSVAVQFDWKTAVWK